MASLCRLRLSPVRAADGSAIWETATGIFWGHVQAIKRPTLLEITGPLFMSAPVISNVQYRLKQVDDGTVIAFRHSAFGFVPEEHRDGVARGWMPLFDRIKKQAEALSNPGRRH